MSEYLHVVCLYLPLHEVKFLTCTVCVGMDVCVPIYITSSDHVYSAILWIDAALSDLEKARAIAYGGDIWYWRWKNCENCRCYAK